MLNQVVLVGRLVRDPELMESEGKEVGKVMLAIPRSFKNEEGQYDTDFVESIIYGVLSKTSLEYLHKGDIVGIKGRVQSNTVEENGEKKYRFEIIAERVTFLSSKRPDEKEEEGN